MIKENNEEKASISVKSVKRIIGIALLLIFMLGIAVLAGNAQINTVKIISSDNYEMDVISSKTKVKDILEEKHITILADEKVTPGLEENIDNNKKIIISKLTDDEELVQMVDSEKEISLEDILPYYNEIVEKIVIEEVAIPYETITKYVSQDTQNTTERVLKNGEDGIKRVTYRIKYQNNIEIERVEISSEIIKEPVNKIVQVQKVTSRSSSSRSATAVYYGNGKWSYSASEMDLICAITAQECGSSYAGALAVITTACNRAEKKGTDPLTEYKAKGQFCYSIDNNWKRRLNGNYSASVQQAVTDALNGKRNHGYYSFRSASTGRAGTVIGGNVYF